MEIEYVPLDDLVPYDKNPRNHPEEQLEKLRKEFKANGFDQPIVIDEDSVIIKGHGRYYALKSMGEKLTVPCVRRADLTAEQARLSRIVDNKVASSEWDEQKLYDDILSMQEAGGSLEDIHMEEDEFSRMESNLGEDFHMMSTHSIDVTDTEHKCPGCGYEW